LRIDTGVTYPPDHIGVSLGPAGRNPAWTITSSLVDPVGQTVLLGFVSFSEVPPVRDTLAYLHFVLDSSGSPARTWVDTTMIGDNFLSITDVHAVERLPGWSPAEIRVGYQPPPPSICVSTGLVNFEAQAGGPLPPPSPLTISDCRGDSLAWQITHQAAWLALSATSGASTSTQVAVSVTTTSLLPGDYADTLTIAGDSADNSPQTVAVTYRVSPSPGLVDYLYIVPDTLRIRGPYADTAFRLSVWLANDHVLTSVALPLELSGLPELRLDSSIQHVQDHPGIDWGLAGADPAWTIRTCWVTAERTFLFGFISFSAYPAYASGSLVDLYFVLDSSVVGGIATLDSGVVLNQHLGVTDPNAIEITPRWRPGVILVGDSLPAPQICLDTDSLAFEAVQSDTLPADQEIRFHNCRPGRLDWNVQDNATWLDLAPSAGQSSGATVTAHVNTTHLPQGVHWAIVTVHNESALYADVYLRVKYTIHPPPGDRLYVGPGVLTLPANRDTAFTVPIMLELSSIHAIGIVVPLTYAGSGANIRLDTLVEDGLGHRGVTQGPLGASPVWDYVDVRHDPLERTILLGYVSFGAPLLPPQHDTLAVLHFAVAGQPGTQLFALDTTMIPPSNHLGIHDPLAGELPVGWAGGVISIGPVGVTGYEPLARGFSLDQNVPNPFNAATRILFEVPQAAAGAAVSVSIHDVLGRRVRRLVEGSWPAGPHQLTWDGADEGGQPVASGVYFIVLESQSTRLVKKALLLR
jgi:hypothetical protein